ncbi:hypothetical protein AVEN_122559-1 [Araneus ventricosus]|uniref:Uncharacterized protein n=1 Tax=Araneus ventricosus TaxID=182803 RepID=A0A4Y2IRW1_ARAVE|nr:hypothetical protein AVEN_122559-1 [Araneus ventricosus]
MQPTSLMEAQIWMILGNSLHLPSVKDPDSKVHTFSYNTGLPDITLQAEEFGRGGLVVRIRGRRVPSSKPDSTEDPPCMLLAKSDELSSNILPLVWCGS